MTLADHEADRTSRTRQHGAVARLVYRSRAVHPLTVNALDDLVSAAQLRNSSENLTGLVLYDQGRFLQWLEGPVEPLGRVLSSIRADNRHTDIEILQDHAFAERAFDGWAMQLAANRDMRSPEAIVAPQALLTSLHTAPDEAATLLPSLLKCDLYHSSLTFDPAGITLPISNVLRRSIQSPSVFLQICERLSRESAVKTRQKIAEALTRDFGVPRPIEITLDRSERLLLFSSGSHRERLDVIEDAAIALAAEWVTDRLSFAELTLAGVLLGLILRRLCRAERGNISGVNHCLVAPFPGEPDILRAMLDAAMLDSGRNSVTLFIPNTDEDLLDHLVRGRASTVVLSSSLMFMRDHRSPDMARLVRKIRQNVPALRVVVGGRLFKDDEAAGAMIGADSISLRSIDIEGAIDQAHNLSHSRVH